ncbi:hypothetical protein AB0392_14685 [Nonomuraea angiospora]|uniref:hypothetical protein n=1 Tax=Nonomuraea angiospora TaxID=46172 RepID=UPI00344B6E89
MMAVAGMMVPATPRFGPAIEPYYPTFDEVANCNDFTEKPDVVDFRSLVLAANPGTADWGILSGHCDDGPASGHKDGRAWDWSVSVYTQKNLADQVLN